VCTFSYNRGVADKRLGVRAMAVYKDMITGRCATGAEAEAWIAKDEERYTATETVETKAYAAGMDWKLAGNKKLPTFVEIDGCKYPVTKSRGDAAKAFSRGWKSCK
jgi:hypothetical protein